ncbi:hypothetical protein ACJX0J_009370, partial [Zea mays]
MWLSQSLYHRLGLIHSEGGFTEAPLILLEIEIPKITFKPNVIISEEFALSGLGGDATVPLPKKDETFRKNNHSTEDIKDKRLAIVTTLDFYSLWKKNMEENVTEELIQDEVAASVEASLAR